jgi:hypothetical protein
MASHRSVQALATKAQRNVIRMRVLPTAGDIRQQEASVLRMPRAHAAPSPVRSSFDGAATSDIDDALHSPAYCRHFLPSLQIPTTRPARDREHVP